MKKIIIFLMAIIGFSFFTTDNVSAKTFVEGNYIDNIYVVKEKGGTKFYQRARFFIRNGTNAFAYCVEPFATFDEETTYSRNQPVNLTDYQKNRISLIAYFGYKYGNHLDAKWYAITQFLIWKESDPASDVYFTDTLNGNRITAFTSEINEIYNLVNDYEKIPSFSYSDINIVDGKELTLNDNNNVLTNYKVTNSNSVKINGNKLSISNVKEGDYTISLKRDDNRVGYAPIYFHSDSSQDMMVAGDIGTKSTYVKIHMIKTKLEITKIDKDTKSIKPSGNASLIGATYELYDADMNLIDTLVIGDDNKVIVPNLDFGKYFIKEIKAGKGYTLDDEIHSFEITPEEPNYNLILENKVIEKEISIHKEYGDGTITNNEANILFNIYDKEGNLYTSITTDNNGFAKVILPYGEYTFKQMTTTDGYKSNDPFLVSVTDSDKKEIKLYDYKIKVPNTKKDSFNLITFIIMIIGSLYGKKTIMG